MTCNCLFILLIHNFIDLLFSLIIKILKQFSLLSRIIELFLINIFFLSLIRIFNDDPDSLWMLESFFICLSRWSFIISLRLWQCFFAFTLGFNEVINLFKFLYILVGDIRISIWNDLKDKMHVLKWDLSLDFAWGRILNHSNTVVKHILGIGFVQLLCSV